eukprot:TRINITY_DN6815_c0_g1_i1.p1 TRINITY_DN6815_c0_g1~~TRINITY_DN6815_c0_g1_i1.p1  ORF type:complete len:311 (-),score=61.89 TRINITY_DN6815_c0_g1_i1:17-949(-)
MTKQKTSWMKMFSLRRLRLFRSSSKELVPSDSCPPSNRRTNSSDKISSPLAKKSKLCEDYDAAALLIPDLPEDVLCFIFAFLSVEDLLLGVSRVSRRWNELVSSGRVYLLHPWIYKTEVKRNTKFRTEGRDFFDKKMWKESIESFSRAIILNPRDHLSYFWRAYAYDESGQYDLAVKDFSKSLEFEPQDATAYSNRGATYRDMGAPEKALRDLQKALEMDPQSAPVHNNVGVVLGDMGFFEEALREYTKALEIDPNHVVALRNRGRRLEKLGRVKEAQDDFSRVLQLNAQDAVALRFFQTQHIPVPLQAC